MKIFNFVLLVGFAFLISCDLPNEVESEVINEKTKVKLSIESSREIKELKEKVSQEINSPGLRMEENYIDNADWFHVLRDPKEDWVNYTLPMSVKKESGGLTVRNLIIVRDNITEKLSYALINITYENGQTGFTIHDLEKGRVFSNGLGATSESGRQMMFCYEVSFEIPWTIIVGETVVHGSDIHTEVICDDGGGTSGSTGDGGNDGEGFFPIPISGGTEGGNSDDADISLVDNPVVEEAVEAYVWENNNIELSEEFEDNPCAKGVYDALMENNALYSTTKNFTQNVMDMNINLKFDIMDEPCEEGKICAGVTDPTNDNEIMIFLNKSYLESASEESVARTILHESIHAHLGYYVKIINNRDDVSINDFPGIFYFYANFSEWQHEQMAGYYRGVIQTGLKSFAPSKSNDFYEGMSWSGLQDTDFWNDLSNSKKEEYLNTIVQEAKKGGCI